MSITSLSFTFVNMYAPQSAKPAAATERQAPAAQAGTKSCDDGRPVGRQNRLVEAMMSALRELGFGSQAAATPASAATTDSPAAAATSQTNASAAVTPDAGATTATATAAAADTTTSTDGATAATTDAQNASKPAASVESAVHQFAHELFSALRQIGRGQSSEQGSDRIDGDGGRRHHHGHNGWGREGYGDMAQRLDALSQTFAAPTAVAAASDAQAASTAAVSTSVSVTLTVQDGQADSPAEAVTTATPAAGTTEAAAPAATAAAAAPAATTDAAVPAATTDAAVPAATTDAAVPASTPNPAAGTAQEIAKNPLLDAFSKLFTALKPESAGAAPTDIADKLRTFLQTLAQAMRPETMSSIQTPQVGGLVNVTA